MAFTCSPEDLKAVTDLVGSGLAAPVCSSVNVAAAGSPLAAVLQHLAAAASAPVALNPEQSAATDAAFMLFSGYLVFMMQAGFAVVRGRPGGGGSGATGLLRVTARAPRTGCDISHPAAPPRSPQLCAGHMRPKNNGNILLKNLLDCAIGTLAWYLVG
jgi:hypothetical protein